MFWSVGHQILHIFVGGELKALKVGQYAKIDILNEIGIIKILLYGSVYQYRHGHAHLEGC